jgi:tRNA nucleotidyltransferase (CCA-adding enzyme)
MLMKSDKPSIAFSWMFNWGILEELFPELYVLAFIEQGKKHHPEGSVMSHTWLTIDAVPKEKRTLPLMLAALLHDTGKAVGGGEVDENDPDHIHFHGHAEDGVETAMKFLERITNEKKLIEEVTTLIKYHMRPYNLAKHPRRKLIRRLATKVHVPTLLELYKADKNGRGKKVSLDLSFTDKILAIYHEIEKEIKPILKGQHLIDYLKLEPGKHFGKILKEAFEAQLDGIFDTVDEGIEYVRNTISL